MMVIGLHLPLKSLPLDGMLAKSQSTDSETIRPLSFGEILKLKEKQLQQDQGVSATSIAAALAALQNLPAILPVLLPNAFIYLDPPYLPETRTALNTYNIEMDKKDHEDMLALIKASPAKILLSGYENDLYNKELSSWNRFEKTVVNNASQTKKKNTRKEVLWANY